MIALATISRASALPLVKQEFIPSNVDEAEFEVSVNGPEGTNLAVMNETIGAMEKEFWLPRCAARLVFRGR